MRVGVVCLTPGGGQGSKQVHCMHRCGTDIKTCGPQDTVPENDFESTERLRVNLSGPAETLPCLLDIDRFM